MHQKLASKIEVFCLVLFLFLSNKWLPLQEGIKYVQAGDSRSYLIIANLSPKLPDFAISYYHAQRFFIHYLVGSISKIASIDLELVYKAFAIIFVISICWLLQKLLMNLGLSTLWRRLLLSLFILNPYSFRYYLLAPTMIADLLFVLGLGILYWGLSSKKKSLLFLGTILGMLGRQNMLLTLPITCLWILAVESWRTVPKSQKTLAIIGVLIANLGTHWILGKIVEPFCGERPFGAEAFITFFTWFFSETFSWSLCLEHIARVYLPHLFFILLTVILFVFDSKKQVHKFLVEFYLSWLMAFSLILQPLVVDPILTQKNESRQSAIALLLACIATAFLVKSNKIKTLRWRDIPLLHKSIICAGIFLGSLHHLYTNIGPSSDLQLLAYQGTACILIFMALTSLLNRKNFS